VRLYIENKNTGEKTHLRLTAKSRKELASSIGDFVFVVDGKQYHVMEVKAEQGADSATVAALVGGFVGALGGPAGVVLGSAIGAIIGSGQVNQEKKEVESFNGSSA